MEVFHFNHITTGNKIIKYTYSVPNTPNGIQTKGKDDNRVVDKKKERMKRKMEENDD